MDPEKTQDAPDDTVEPAPAPEPSPIEAKLDALIAGINQLIEQTKRPERQPLPGRADPGAPVKRTLADM